MKSIKTLGLVLVAMALPLHAKDRHLKPQVPLVLFEVVDLRDHGGSISMLLRDPAGVEYHVYRTTSDLDLSPKHPVGSRWLGYMEQGVDRVLIGRSARWAYIWLSTEPDIEGNPTWLNFNVEKVKQTDGGEWVPLK
jgi:hypothetical protein